ncbi:MAG: beta-propeller domain-containing protein, partial [Ruminococcus sp.]
AEESVDGAFDSESAETTEEADVSKVYNQEQGVIEGDIVQTDGRKIYSVQSGSMRLNIAETDGNVFTDSKTVNLMEYLPETVRYGSISSMYLENGRLIIAVDANENNTDTGEAFNRTHILVFSAENELALLGGYSQDGSFKDIRLMEDGTLYLVTVYDWTIVYYENDDYSQCIPAYYTDNTECTITPEGILLPDSEVLESEECTFDSSFTNIGSLNVFSDTPSESVDFKSLAGFSGSMYCSPGNIYLASSRWTERGSSTDFTRISIDNGNITPEASANAMGYVKDQFSMSEYGGYFRAAVSRTHNIASGSEFLLQNDNAVYVFDMDLQKVGEIGGFGKNESVKSASFQGDMAYVVTFRQTDPLYAIDLSDPASPVILDEYKITGYSSYMQQWSENRLLGFGIDADEDGVTNGLKLVMFDNSDPENLTECGVMPIRPENVTNYQPDNRSYGWISSPAEYDRKALLIAPDKNIIAVPFYCVTNLYSYDKENYYYGAAVYSYDDECFTQKGIFYLNDEASRIIYIGNTVYIIGSSEMSAVDIMTMTETDKIYF